MWGQDIRIVIIPSFLAIAYLGQSPYFHLISRFNRSPPSLATWLGQLGASIFVQGQLMSASWGATMGVTGLAASMAVNALGTGLIVFKILKVFLEVNPILVELTLDSTGGTKLKQVIFVIIESGMALFAVQLIRLVFSFLPVELTPNDYVIVIQQALNVIMRSVYYIYFSFH